MKSGEARQAFCAEDANKLFFLSENSLEPSGDDAERDLMVSFSISLSEFGFKIGIGGEDTDSGSFLLDTAGKLQLAPSFSLD